MKKKFYDLAQARFYLNECVIRYKGDPIYVVGVGARNRIDNPYIQYIYLEKEKNKYDYPDVPTVDIYHPDVDMTPVPLGMCFVNAGGQRASTVYTYRVPARRCCIGLNRQNFKNVPVFTGDGRGPVRLETPLFKSKYIANTILGNYHTYQEAIKGTKDASYNKAIPFSRRFAILNGDTLVYKAFKVPVGYVENGEPMLSEDFEYLTESLEEDMENG